MQLMNAVEGNSAVYKQEHPHQEMKRLFYSG